MILPFERDKLNTQHVALTMSSQEWPRYQEALDSFLKSSQGNLTPATSSRVAKAREKLKKLTRIQFSDLSTDVYDEMQRREATRLDPDNPSLPKYLASQPNYHPKRNQARQKLAALPPSRFKDLVNDVLFEIGNRMHKEEKLQSNGNDLAVEKDAHEKGHSTKFEESVSDIDHTITSEQVNNHSGNKAKNVEAANNLQIDVGKATQFNDDFFSDLKTPQTSDFLGTNVSPATPSQREIKPTTLVPKKSELTWSSDEDDDIEDQSNNHKSNITHDDIINATGSLDNGIVSNKGFEEKLGSGIIDASGNFPGKLSRDEQIKSSALPQVDSAEQNSALKNELQELKFKVDELELENSHLKALASEQKELRSENDSLKTQIETLSRNHAETNDHLKSLTTQYADYDEIKQELYDAKGQLSAQSEELESLRQITDLGHEKQLSVEDSREFDTLKTYLDKVLEENEELKSKLATQTSTREVAADDGKHLDELESLKREHDILLKSHKSLNENYELLKIQSEELSNKLEKQQALSISTAKGNSGNIVEANTTAVLDWQNKFESLRANQIQTALSSLCALPKFSDQKAFSPTGYISIDSIAKVNAALETILIYMDSKDDSAESLVDPSVLFERVANFVSSANMLSKEVNVSSSDRNFVRIEEKKRILKNAISNALSTTKHFALYRHILPSLVLNAALNDVYFSVCSLISLAKIRGDGSRGVPEIQTELLQDNATITATPIALKKISEIEESPSENPNPAANNTETSVRPLRITQRLASGSALDLNEFSKPGQPNGSRSGSPISRKILSSPILPIIATSKKSNDHDGAKLTPNAKRSVTRNGSVENINDSVIKPNLSSAVSDEPLMENAKQNGSKISVSSLASKFSSPDHNNSPSANASKSNVPSPSRGKNIVDKLKKFDTSADDVRAVNNVRGLPGSSKLKVGNDVAKAFDKFGAKRRSVNLSSESPSKDESIESSKENNDTSEKPHSREVIKDANKVLLNKDLNTVNDSINRNPFIDGSSSTKKGSLFGDEEPNELPLKVKEKDSIVPNTDSNGLVQANGNITTSANVDNEQVAKDSSDDVINNSTLKSNDGKLLSKDSLPETFAPTITNPDGKNPKAIANGSNNLNDQRDDVETFEGDEYFNAPDYGNAKSEGSGLPQATPEEDLPELQVPHNSSPKKNVEPLNLKLSSPSKQNDLDVDQVRNEDYDDFNNYEGANSRGSGGTDPLPSAGSALDIDENLARRVSKRQSFRKSVQSNNQRVQHDEDGKEGWNYNGESEEDEEEEFDVDKFNTLNPDNTLRELLLYLEHQTVEVIGAIQKTLQSIRDPKATKGLLRSGTAEINSVVKQMAEGTSTLMNQSRYSESMGHAKYVVGVLEDCVQRMEALYGQDTSHDGEYAGKNFKQRSAGIAFDVARSTKELVKTVEEASLRDEIAVLDSRLRRD